MPGLYDRYKLENSNVIPLYEGSAAPEMIAVGQDLQKLYDTARTGGNALSDAAVNLDGFNEVDKQHAREVQEQINGRIKEYATKGNWEDHVEDVASLGRFYAQRAAELQAPFQQYKDWVEKEVENKDLNLTPQQKSALIARARAGYQGLQKDNMGRLVGGFQGIRAAKNKNIPEFLDKVLGGMKEFEGASSVEHVDGTGYIVKRGNKTTVVTDDRVQAVLNNALASDTDMQALLTMERENAGFIAGQYDEASVPDIIDGKPNTLKQDIKAYAAQQGISFQEAASAVVGNKRVGDLYKNMQQYGRNKYAFKKTESEYGLSGDPVWAAANAKEEDEYGIFGALATDGAVNVQQKYKSADDVDAQGEAASTNYEIYSEKVQGARQQAARALGKPVSAITDEDVLNHLSTQGGTALGEYRTNLQNMQASKATLDEISAIHTDGMNQAIRKKLPGAGNITEMTAQATKDLKDALTKHGGSIQLRPNGPETAATRVRTVKGADLDNYEVVDGGGTDVMSNPYLVLRDKRTGQEYRVNPGGAALSDKSKGNIQAEDANGKIDWAKTERNLKPSLLKIADRFRGLNWHDSFNSLQGIKSNTVWLPVMDKTTADGHRSKGAAYAEQVKGVLSASTTSMNILNPDFSTLSDTDDDAAVRASIAAGKYKLNGIGKVHTNGKMYAKVSVDMDPQNSDPTKRYKTVVVGVESNVGTRMGQLAIEYGQKNKDRMAVQYGQAMMPGSGWEMAMGLGETGQLVIKDPSTGKAHFQVIANPTQDPNNPMTYEVFELDPATGRRLPGKTQSMTSTMDVGSFIDYTRSLGGVPEKYNKR